MDISEIASLSLAANEKLVIEIPVGMPAEEVAAIRQNARDNLGPNAKILVLFGTATGTATAYVHAPPP